MARKSKRRAESNCLSCAHLVYDEQWGEYKCKARAQKLYDYNEFTDCKRYKPKNSKEAK